jgi:hypothetical protein
MTHKYNIGDEFYLVSRKIISLERKKERKIDENGVEWFRYLNERFEYSIKKAKIIALNYIMFEGPIITHEDYRDKDYLAQYALFTGYDLIVAYEDELDYNDYRSNDSMFFRDKKQAQECLERWKNQ